MLLAKRKSDGKTVLAYFEDKANGPFYCPECHDLVLLRAGKSKSQHFAHEYPLKCQFGENESDKHRICKTEIYETLISTPGVRDVALERSFGVVRADVSAVINGVRVAIEVQISSLSLETILERTLEGDVFVQWNSGPQQNSSFIAIVASCFYRFYDRYRKSIIRRTDRDCAASQKADHRCNAYYDVRFRPTPRLLI